MCLLLEIHLIIPFIELKVKLFLCLTKHHAVKAYEEWRYSCT